MAQVQIAGKTCEVRPATLGFMREATPLQRELDKAGTKVDRIDGELASAWSRLSDLGTEGQEGEAFNAIEVEIGELLGRRHEAAMLQHEARLELLRARVVDPPALDELVQGLDLNELAEVEQKLNERPTKKSTSGSSSS